MVAFKLVPKHKQSNLIISVKLIKKLPDIEGFQDVKVKIDFKKPCLRLPSYFNIYIIFKIEIKKKKRYIRSNELLKFHIYSNHIFSN